MAFDFKKEYQDFYAFINMKSCKLQLYSVEKSHQ